MDKDELDKNLAKLEERFTSSHQNGVKNYDNSFEEKLTKDINSNFVYECLRRCCYNKNLNVADWIIRKNPEILLKNTEETPPLEIACEMGYEEVIELLLEHLKSITTDDSKIQKILCEALCTLIKRSADKHRPEGQENCFNKIFEIIKSRKIDIESCKDGFGYTALFYAKYYNLPETELKLLEVLDLTKEHDGVITIDKIDPDILRQHLDNCVRVDADLDKKRNNYRGNITINVNYRLLCPDLLPESKILFEIGHRKKFDKLLCHPVILCFLLMKWNVKIYKIWFWASLLVSIFDIFLFCGYIISNFVALKIVFTIIQLFQAMSMVVNAWKSHTRPDKLFSIILSLGAIVIIWISREENPEFSKLSLFIVNVMLTFKVIFHLRIYTMYGEMFKIILWRFFKILAFYVIVLFLPLACGHYLIFYENQSVSATNITKSFYDIFTMSVGNVPENPTSLIHILVLLFFVVLVSIAFFNLLTAQAVTDIAKLKKSADIVCLREQIRFLYDTEKLCKKIFKRLDLNVFKNNSKVLSGIINPEGQNSDWKGVKLDRKTIDGLNVLLVDHMKKKIFVTSGLIRIEGRGSQDVELQSLIAN